MVELRSIISLLGDLDWMADRFVSRLNCSCMLGTDRNRWQSLNAVIVGVFGTLIHLSFYVVISKLDMFCDIPLWRWNWLLTKKWQKQQKKSSFRLTLYYGYFQSINQCNKWEIWRREYPPTPADITERCRGNGASIFPPRRLIITLPPPPLLGNKWLEINK